MKDDADGMETLKTLGYSQMLLMFLTVNHCLGVSWLLCIVSVNECSSFSSEISSVCHLFERWKWLPSKPWKPPHNTNIISARPTKQISGLVTQILVMYGYVAVVPKAIFLFLTLPACLPGLPAQVAAWTTFLSLCITLYQADITLKD